MSLPETLLVRDDLAVMRYHKLLVGVWYAKPTLASALEIEAHYRKMRDAYPSGFVACAIVEDGVPLPDETVRRVVGRVMDEMRGSLIAKCGVQEAIGFRGAAIRSVLTSLVLLTTPPYKTTTVRTVGEASDWLAPFLSPASAAEIQGAIAHFRATAQVRRFMGSDRRVG